MESGITLTFKSQPEKKQPANKTKEEGTYTMEYYSATIENSAICNFEGIKWGKSDRERQILEDLTYMWNLKKRNS